MQECRSCKCLFLENSGRHPGQLTHSPIWSGFFRLLWFSRSVSKIFIKSKFIWYTFSEKYSMYRVDSRAANWLFHFSSFYIFHINICCSSIFIIFIQNKWNLRSFWIFWHCMLINTSLKNLIRFEKFLEKQTNFWKMLK